MSEVDIEIGGRLFKVACQEGEESHLHSAAKILDDEATHLMNAAGRLPEPKMLLMAGLMLADKYTGLRDGDAVVPVANPETDAKLAEAEARISALEAELADQARANDASLSGMVEQVEKLARDLNA